MDQFYAIVLSSISILLVSIFWCKIAFKKIQAYAPLPPGPRGLPIVGYLPFLQGNLLHQFTELAERYGPIFKLRLGTKLCVVISSPALTKQIVRDHDVTFSNRDVTIAARTGTYGGNDIAWSPYNSRWRSLRKLFVREMLSKNSLEASRNLRIDEVKKAIRNVYHKAGQPIEIAELSFLIELNVIMNMLWGGINHDDEEGERIRMEFRELVPKFVDLLIKPNIGDLFPVLAWLDIQGVKKQMECYAKTFDRIIEPVIAEHMEKLNREENDEGKKDFLQLLLEQMVKQDSKEFSITQTDIKGILLDVVIGGTDTTSATLDWAMAEVMKNPEVMKKVQNELADVVGLDNIVEEFHVPKLHYLLAVLKETMRLHPAVPLLVPRSPSQSAVVGGYTVPEKTRVLINVWSIQRDPSIWDNPSEFKPERFLKDDVKLDFSGNSFHYLPFGSGRRACVGTPLAEKMLIYLLASLLHSFEWKLPEDKLDMEDTVGIVLRKRTPLVAIPSPRLSNLDLYYV